MKSRKKKPTKKRNAPNPLRIDPTRTAGLRRAFSAQLKRRFAQLRLAIANLFVKEDVLGMNPPGFSLNAFCPTGEGGGIDPTCSPSEVASMPKAALHKLAKEHGISNPERVSEKKLRKFMAGYLADSAPKASTKDLLDKNSAAKHTDEYVQTVEKPVQARIRSAPAKPELMPAIDKAAQEYAAKHASGFISLKELQDAAAPGVERDSFLHTVMKGVESGRYRLHPFTSYYGSMRDHEHTIPMGRELMQYVEVMGTRNSYAVNDNWRFRPNADKIKAFQSWLRQQYRLFMIGQAEEELWQRYIEEGYRKGAGRAWDDTNQSTRTRATDQRKLDFYAGTRQQFLRSAFGQPESVEKVKLLAGRSFDDLEGVTSDMSTRMSRVLTDGLVQGKGPREIARELNKQVDLGETRALTVARTELIRAHAEGQLDSMESLGVEEVGVMVEWSTAGDDRVCAACQPMEGVVLKLAEARGMIPRHPGCRCSFIPAQVGEDDADQKNTKKEITGAIRDSRRVSDDGEWGPGSKISKVRPESILDNALVEFSRFVWESVNG